MIPALLTVFAKAYRTVVLSLYAMDCDSITRSMSLTEHQVRFDGWDGISLPEGEIQLSFITPKRHDTSVWERLGDRV